MGDSCFGHLRGVVTVMNRFLAQKAFWVDAIHELPSLLAAVALGAYYEWHHGHGMWMTVHEVWVVLVTVAHVTHGLLDPFKLIRYGLKLKGQRNNPVGLLVPLPGVHAHAPVIPHAHHVQHLVILRDANGFEAPGAVATVLSVRVAQNGSLRVKWVDAVLPGSRPSHKHVPEMF